MVLLDLDTDPLPTLSEHKGIQFDVKPWHLAAMHLWLTGREPRDIAEQLNKSYPIVRKLIDGPWGQAQIAAFNARLTERHIDAIIDPITKFNTKIVEKIDMLDAMTHSPDEKVALAAIREWINHAIGSPVRRSEVMIEHILAARTTDELRFIKEYGRAPSNADELEEFKSIQQAIDGEVTLIEVGH